MNGGQSGGIRFTPHWSQSLNVFQLFPMVLAAAVLLHLSPAERFGVGAFIAAAAGLAASGAAVISAGIRRRHTSLSLEGGMMLFRCGGVRKSMSLETCVCVETCREPVRGVFGAVRVRLYSGCARRPWASLVLPEDRAEEFIRCFLQYRSQGGEDVPGFAVKGKQRAAASAVTSDGTVLPVFAAAQLSVFAGGSLCMNVLAGALLLAALAHIILTFCRCRGLSLTRRQNALEVTSGFFGGRKALVPTEALDGIRVHAGMAELLLGCGKAELVCTGGRRIPCLCGLPLSQIRKTAFLLMDADSRKVTAVAEPAALCRHYTRLLTAAVFVLLPVWIAAWRSESGSVRLTACLMGIWLSTAVLHCGAGLKTAGHSGLTLTPSAICAGGMGLWGAEQLFVRRGHAAGMRLKSTVFERMDDLCSAAVFTSGRSPGVWCRCIPLGEVNGLIARFY